MKRLVLWVPLGIFIMLVILVGVQLSNPSDRVIRSRLVGRPMPDFVLPAALPGRPGLQTSDFTAGQPRVVNVFASWCVPCIAEAPYLLELEKKGVPIDALAIRDRTPDIARFLERWGDPYQRIAADNDSRVQLALGSSGVPETFVVDGRGIIRYQHLGPITPENVAEIVAAYEAAK